MDVEEGQVVAIIGPSGSGKSTLLRCATSRNHGFWRINLCGEKAVTTVDGKAVYAPPKDLKRIQRYFGLVFQNFNLFPHYSVIKILLIL